MSSPKPSILKPYPFWRTVDECAEKYNLDPCFISAIIQVESAGNVYAMRYEPRWTYFLDCEIYAKMNNITVKTEAILQACSWGLMQVMGSVARELGHQGSLIELSQARRSIDYGCKKLDQLNQKYSNYSDVAAAYNAGSARPSKKNPEEYVNQTYVEKVLYWFSSCKEKEIRRLDRDKKLKGV